MLKQKSDNELLACVVCDKKYKIWCINGIIFSTFSLIIMLCMSTVCVCVKYYALIPQWKKTKFFFFPFNKNKNISMFIFLNGKFLTHLLSSSSSSLSFGSICCMCTHQSILIKFSLFIKLQYNNVCGCGCKWFWGSINWCALSRKMQCCKKLKFFLF